MNGPAFSLGLDACLERLRFLLDCSRFTARRADYFDYLSVLMQDAMGRFTLKHIFEQDVHRYGLSTVRGRLSLRWARAFQATGGDLYATWLGCFPLAELNLLRAAQMSGNLALIRSLDDLAQAVLMTQRARRIVLATSWTAAACLCVLAGMILAVPAYTVPRLRQVFSAVPADFHAGLTRALFGFSDLVAANWPLVPVLVFGAFGALLWSFPNLTGGLRRRLDAWSPWRVYRDVHAMHFLALLTVVLARSDSASTQLRTALLMQRPGATPWLNWHLDTMLARVDAGLTGSDTFDTGLLDRELHWFLGDMAAAHGLTPALALVRQRLAGRILDTVLVRARAMRWIILLSCLAALIGVALWHYAVIDELRRALMFHYAGH